MCRSSHVVWSKLIKETHLHHGNNSTAPTIHSGRKEPINDLLASGNGYGMVMVKSSEVATTILPDEPEPIEIRSDDYLKANDLCFKGQAVETYEHLDVVGSHMEENLTEELTVVQIAKHTLISTDVWVIDLAFKYSYDSPDSFTKAFTHLPPKIRHRTPLNN